MDEEENYCGEKNQYLKSGGWMDGRMDKWMDWTDLMDGWMDDWTDLMDGWTD